MKNPHLQILMGIFYELYYFYPNCIASGFIYLRNTFHPKTVVA